MTGEVVLVGASGEAGRHLLAALLADHVPVKAVTSRGEGEAALRSAGVPAVARADLDDPPSLRSAFAGARAVYLIPPALHPREDELAANAVRAAVELGVPRFVYHSVLHPCTPALRNHLRKARAEAEVRNSPIRWTILQPSMYAQVVLAMVARGGTEVAVPFDVDAPLAVLDLADLAEVGARVLAEEGHDYATYELAGPVTTMARMVALAGVRRGVRARAVAVSPQSAPLPSPARSSAMAAADMISTFAHYDTHGFPGNSTVLEMLLGRPATTFDRVADRIL